MALKLKDEFSFHYNYFRRSMRKLAAAIEEKKQTECQGWLAFLTRKQPQLHEKYLTMEGDLNQLWDKEDSQSMEQFKDLCQKWENAIRWSVDAFFTSKKGGHEES